VEHVILIVAQFEISDLFEFSNFQRIAGPTEDANVGMVQFGQKKHEDTATET
jgi:hypothetical protein